VRGPYRKRGLTLTDFDRQVVTLICQGWNLRNCALILHTTEDTVKSHAKRLRARFGAANLPHLISMLYEQGLLNPKRNDEQE
jgi:FixJ family two-component response regulator